MEVARKARLRAFDALYVATAPAHDATLITLDRALAERAQATYPELRVPTPR